MPTKTQSIATVAVQIARFNPDTDARPYLQKYDILKEERQSVLQALQYIYEELDPTIAFRYSCRFKRCGQCAVEIDGKPRLACLTELKPGMVIRPLSRLPVLRDLVLDRTMFLKMMKKLHLYIPGDIPTNKPQIIIEPERHQRLVKCVECLCCLAECPSYDYRDASFGGPFLFVKLATLHSDPRDRTNRLAQARKIGIDKCRQCDKCRLYCPVGINIFKDAIQPLFGNRWMIP